MTAQRVESPSLRPAGVLTMSTKGARGDREDTSGAALRELLTASGFAVTHSALIPDDADLIAATLIEWVDQADLHLILTTGGTGLSPTDVTPEATLRVLHRLAPGISEAMRVATLAQTPMAMLSRGVAGSRLGTLIINMPGSPRAVRECFAVVAPVLQHAVEILRGAYSDHPSGSSPSAEAR